MKYNLDIFGVSCVDPGYIYLVSNGDLIKIGKTNHPLRRLKKEARTWLPDLEIIAVKPFWGVTQTERDLHTALSSYWYHGEWCKISDENDRELLVEGMQELSDDDRDTNSVDFIYFMNSSGMAEFCIELSERQSSLRAFQKEESISRKS